MMEGTQLYHTLDVSKKEVRLVTLLPGGLSEDIYCTLTTVSLIDKPFYEALSYVWGNLTNKCDINLQSLSFPVTTNLESALRYLRYRDLPRVLWIDAICINQEDIPERNSQVKYMGTIYSKSSIVLAWLGEPKTNKCLTSSFTAGWMDKLIPEGDDVDEERDNDLVFDTFEKMLKDLEAHWESDIDDVASFSTQNLRTGAGIIRLFENPWWNRMWTVQEALLGKDTLLISGRRSILQNDLSAIFNSQLAHSKDGCNPRKSGFITTSLMKMRFVREYRDGNASSSLEGLLNIFGERRCSDPRDKIYGLLGILATEEVNFIHPDYSIDIVLLYGNTVMDIINKARNLDILSQLWPRKWHCTGILAGQGPSWIRDWTAERPSHVLVDTVSERYRLFPKFSASGKSSAIVKERRKLGIVIRGIFLNSLQVLGRPNDVEVDNDEEMAMTYREWRQLAQSETQFDQPYPSSSRITAHSDAFSQTLCMSIASDSSQSNNSASEYYYRRVSNDSQARKNHHSWWESEIEGTPRLGGKQLLNAENANSDIIRFHTLVYFATHMRRFFIAKEPRWIGLVPMDAQIGDQLFLLEGGKVPYILRRMKGKEEYKIIGDCYVHGIMDGEEWNSDKLEDVILV
ncbi:putative heterokaryon incompatibility protein [Botrytis fragariae]|uniref:Putative heterokaryon incompatibility protein n=1 Tax=Botrytis fragariae TaxID=1964551 RepID=A0A8H6AJZ1_9HELO|nr:putative heterokaryon incompatibility protein [Botrytis fragariae]KAF5868701.1 putative heterokaryon incompatibility protein [Botrytis fragariae]